MSIEIGKVVLRNTVFFKVQPKLVKRPVKTFTFALVYGLVRGRGFLFGRNRRCFRVDKAVMYTSSKKIGVSKHHLSILDAAFLGSRLHLGRKLLRSFRGCSEAILRL